MRLNNETNTSAVYSLFYCLRSVIAQTTYQQSIPDVLTVWSSPIAANPDVLTQQQMLEQNKVNAAQAPATLPGIVMQKSGNRNEYTLKVRGLIVAKFRCSLTVFQPMCLMMAIST